MTDGETAKARSGKRAWTLRRIVCLGLLVSFVLFAATVAYMGSGLARMADMSDVVNAQAYVDEYIEKHGSSPADLSGLRAWMTDVSTPERARRVMARRPRLLSATFVRYGHVREIELDYPPGRRFRRFTRTVPP